MRAGCVLSFFVILLSGCLGLGDGDDRGGSSGGGDCRSGDLNASFTATPLEGSAPLTVQFTDRSVDRSEGEIIEWEWGFQTSATESAHSSERNPTFTFTTPGSWGVELRVYGCDGRSSYEGKGQYIDVD